MRRPTRRAAPALLPAIAVLDGCARDPGIQSVAAGAGRSADLIGSLFLGFAIVTALFYAAVILFLLAAAWRRGGRAQDGIDGEPAAARDGLGGGGGGMRFAFFGWTAAVILGLSGLTLASYLTDRGLASADPGERPVLSIAVTGNQWWWDVEYHFADSSKNIRTANELHLPVGIPAAITLRSNDVIHSLWVPNLAGKQDLIPGRVNQLVLMPRRIGLYRGQCAEFCGLQHAHMALDVTVQSRADFLRWAAAQEAPAPAPTTPLTRAGYAYVTTRECGTCHMIAGTPAAGQVAPDLTHVAGRRSIAAGTYPMDRGHLTAWIADPQSGKPGANMPYVGLSADDLNAVEAYLETLK